MYSTVGFIIPIIGNFVLIYLKTVNPPTPESNIPIYFLFIFNFPYIIFRFLYGFIYISKFLILYTIYGKYSTEF